MSRPITTLALLAGAGMVAVFASGCGPQPTPQITAVSPAPSQGAVHTNVPLEIIFNVPMNRASVETRMKMRSRKGKPPPGCNIARAARGQSTGCHFVWSDHDKVMRLVHPNHPVQVVTTYRIDLKGGVTSAAGAVNSLSHSWAFSTEGGPSLSSTAPLSGGSVGPDQAIAVNFNRAMDLASLKKAITLQPVPTGGYSIAANPTQAGRFLVEPLHPLTPGSSYTLAVTKAAHDVDGNPLQKGAKVKFTVGKLGSASSIDFAAGPTPADYTEVLAASPPLVPGDPPALRVLVTAAAGQRYSFASGSPDGQYLATELAASGSTIQVTDLATGKATSVLGSANSTVAEWSPNSQQLAFLAGGALRVYTVASNQSDTLTALASLQGPLAWRPDSEVLAAVAIPAGSAARIALLSPSLSAVTYLGTAAAAAAAQGNPVWSPTSNSLAFSVGTGNATAVWLYQPTNSSSPLRQLLKDGGQPLAFLSSGEVLVRLASGSLASLSTTTDTETQVVGPASGNYPVAVAVSAATRELSYTRLGGTYVQLYLANEDGTGTVPLTDFGPMDKLNAGPPSYITG